MSYKYLKEKTCILNYQNEKKYGGNNNQENNKVEDTKVQDILLQNLEIGLTSEEYDTSTLEKGENEIFKEEKFVVTLTTTRNEKNNSNINKTIIDLGKCEALLREQYNISDDEFLYMKKIEVIQEGMKIPKVEFDVYSKINGKNLEKLNLTICEDIKILLWVPIIITESLDKLNASSGYYNDICYPAKSKSGTDIILKDRRKEFIEENKTVCQDYCDFMEYDYINQRAKCSCKVKESKASLAEMKINKTTFFENFIDFKNVANIQLIKCYKVLLTKEGIIHNIAFFIVIPIMIFHLIAIILFYIKKKRIIDNIIQDITFGIRNFELVEEHEEEKKGKEIVKILPKARKINEKNENIITFRKKGENNEIKKSKLISSTNNYSATNLLNKHYPKRKKKKNTVIKINNNNINNINATYNNKKSKKDDNYKKTLKADNNDIKKQEVIEKIKEIMKYNDEEKNNLPYELALQFDKRSFCEYYSSLLKTKNLILFSFFNNNDYNSRIIKIDLFFINFTLHYTVNALFFTDKTMHKIYVEKGSFNFIFQLPSIIYSSLISAVLNVLLKLIALSEGTIINFKKNKEIHNLSQRVIELNNKLNIKFILFFIIGFIFELIFWYYLSVFCAVYRNTQIHLIKDTLISFVLSFIYHFGIVLIPGLFRIPSLSHPETKRECLYKLSLLFQML